MIGMNDKQRKQQNKRWMVYYHKNKGKLNKKRRLKLKIQYAINSQPFKERSQKYRDELKYETLKRYSKTNEPTCGNCGFMDIRALCLDHIDNNGSKDRIKMTGKNRDGGGSRFYVLIKKKKYPNGYQTLCANCNLIKEIKKRNVK